MASPKEKRLKKNERDRNNTDLEDFLVIKFLSRLSILIFPLARFPKDGNQYGAHVSFAYNRLLYESNGDICKERDSVSEWIKHHLFLESLDMVQYTYNNTSRL